MHHGPCVGVRQQLCCWRICHLGFKVSTQSSSSSVVYLIHTLFFLVSSCPFSWPLSSFGTCTHEPSSSSRYLFVFDGPLSSKSPLHICVKRLNSRIKTSWVWVILFKTIAESICFPVNVRISVFWAWIKFHCVRKSHFLFVFISLWGI